MRINNSEITRIFLGGDVYTGERAISWGKPVNKFLSDIAWGCVNLEGPILSKDGLAEREPNVPLYSSPLVLNFLKETKVRIVSLANNHITDWGYEGLAATLDVLERNSIRTVGAGLTEKRATKPIVHPDGRATIGLLSFGEERINCQNVQSKGYGCNPMLESLIEEQIKGLRETADIIIVQFHCGLTNYSFPSPITRSLFHRTIDCGADIVIRHHPHVLQGVEYYRKGLIAYSLGNLVFSPILRGHGWMNLSSENLNSMLLVIRILQKKIEGFEFWHTRYDVENNIIKLCDPEEQEKRGRYLDKLSKPLGMNQQAYATFYNRFWYKRMFGRVLWRLHPKRLRELSLTHVRAAWVGRQLR